MIFEFEGRVPKISEKAYVHESAVVIGDVTLSDGVYVGPNATIRGDYGTIVIGENSAVEDNVVIHARPGEKTTIGCCVTIGHGSIIHTATIKDYAVIGMGSIVTDYAVVGKWAVLAEGSVVKIRQVVDDETIVAGVPAQPKGKVNDDYKKQWTEFKGIYVSFCERYKKNLKRIG